MRSTGGSIDVRREASIRVVLADDHAEFRLGTKDLLATDGGIEVVGEAENGAQAVAFAGKVRPDVIVLDLVIRRTRSRQRSVARRLQIRSPSSLTWSTKRLRARRGPPSI